MKNEDNKGERKEGMPITVNVNGLNALLPADLTPD
jgi:hypothetical protein